MSFLIGVLCGVTAAVVARRLLLVRLPMTGVEKPETAPAPSPRKQWTQTHNFLYYDGTVMPEIKEERNEQ